MIQHYRKPISHKPHFEILEDRVLLSVTYQPIDFSQFHNTRFQGLQPASNGLPEGDVTLGGIPFHIPAGSLNAWWGEAASGAYPRSIDIPVDLFGVSEVHTLINTSYGQPGPTSYVTVEFFGADGAYLRKEMLGNDDVRDHFQAFWTNQINNTTTINVATSGPGGLLNESRLDKQFIDLPATFDDEVLTTIRVTDSGGVLISGVILSGLTVGVSGTVDIVAKSMAWDAAQGGIDLTYEITGAQLPQDSEAIVYWASGPSASDIISQAANPVTIPQSTPLDQDIQVHIPASELHGPTPPGATHLLTIIDPNNVVDEADEQNNLVHTETAIFVVVGSDGRDVFDVRSSSTDPDRFFVVRNARILNDAASTPRLSQLQQIRIEGLGGDDIINGNWLRGFGGQFVVDGGAGNDALFGSPGSGLLRGGPGNDTIVSLAGNYVLIGGDGDDYLVSGFGDNILIGGRGADQVRSIFGQNLLIAGFTAFDDNEEALWAIQREWTNSAHDYLTRVMNLRGDSTGSRFGERLNGDYFLQNGGSQPTVFDDNDRDKLFGGLGRDWFFFVPFDDEVFSKNDNEESN